MQVISYQIQLLQPVLVTGLEGDPNSANSLHYIPGSVLRGAFLGAYQREHPTEIIDAGNSALRTLFFNGATRFLNAYPVKEDTRLLPSLHSWQQVKGEEKSSVFDLSMQDKPDDSKQWKRFGRGSFFRLNASSLSKHLVEEHIAVHTARSRVHGRAVQAQPGQQGESGSVFRYISIATGQCFQAAILCDFDTTYQTLQSLAQGKFHIGKASSSGYGLVAIEELPLSPAWREWNQTNLDDNLVSSQ